MTALTWVSVEDSERERLTACDRRESRNRHKEALKLVISSTEERTDKPTKETQNDDQRGLTLHNRVLSCGFVCDRSWKASREAASARLVMNDSEWRSVLLHEFDFSANSDFNRFRHRIPPHTHSSHTL